VEAKRYVKTKVRLFRAEDAIWMILRKKDRNSNWCGIEINADGFCLKICTGIDENGKKTIRSTGSDWGSIAKELGFDHCEYVLNQDDVPFVLLYDLEEFDVR